MEHILTNAILALLDYPGSLLLDLPLMLVDKAAKSEDQHAVVIMDFQLLLYYGTKMNNQCFKEESIA